MNIISAIKEGNESSFEQAYAGSRDKVFHYFLKKTRSEEDARDLLQTTFLKLWQYRHSLNDNYSLDQHLFNIAYTVFVDAWRKQQKAQRISETLHRESPDTPPADHRELDDRLHLLLEQLPPERRKVFILHRLEGYSYKEIATRLSISVKAVDNHVARALKHLKKYFICLLFIILRL